MYRQKKVSVIFPAYNEEENIVSAINDFLATGVVDEIIVVNNNSTDRTAERVLSTEAILVHEEKQGFGNAMQRGLREATGDYIMMAEPDGTFKGDDVFKLLSYAGDFEMVCGTRTVKELIWEAANMNWFIRMGNLVIAKLLEWLYNTPALTDCGCTMRLIRKEALEKFRTRLSVGGSHFLPEMVILASLHGVRLIEIPVNYSSRIGVSKITGSLKGLFQTGLNMVLLMVKYKFKSGI